MTIGFIVDKKGFVLSFDQSLLNRFGLLSGQEVDDTTIIELMKANIEEWKLYEAKQRSKENNKVNEEDET